MECFGFYILTAVYTKKAILGIFVYLFISKVTKTKVNFHFYKQCIQGVTCPICERAIFAQNDSIVY